MKRLLNITPTFNASARTVDLSAIPFFEIKKLYGIFNITRNQIIYALGSQTYGLSSLTGNVLTLVFDTTTHNNADRLAVLYDDQVFEIPSDDSDSVATAIRALPQHVSRIGFARAIASGADPEFFNFQVIGSGQTVSQANGNLILTSGVTARSETILRSTASWKGGIRLRARSLHSQRIINQQFIVELVDVIGDGLAYNITSATAMEVIIPNNPYTAQNIGQSINAGNFAGTGTFLSGRYTIANVVGNVVTLTVSGFAVGTGTCSLFGMNFYRLLYDSATATSAQFQTQRRGYANAQIPVTINTTLTPGHLAVIVGNDLESALYDQLTASGTAVQLVQRATQVENVPDDVDLRLQIRLLNLATAPASTTTWTIGFVAVSNYALQDVLVHGNRAPSAPMPLPVDILRSVALGITGTVTTAISAGTNRIGQIASAGIWFDDSSTALASNATFTGTTRDLTVTATATAWANAATYGQEVVVSAESDVAGTLWLEASRDGGTTWRRIKSVATVAVAGGGQYAEIVHRPSWRSIRVGFTNGATAQARLTVGTFLKAI